MKAHNKQTKSKVVWNSQFCTGGIWPPTNVWTTSEERLKPEYCGLVSLSQVRAEQQQHLGGTEGMELNFGWPLNTANCNSQYFIMWYSLYHLFNNISRKERDAPQLRKVWLHNSWNLIGTDWKKEWDGLYLKDRSGRCGKGTQKLYSINSTLT